jgi:hypothetical protein
MTAWRKVEDRSTRANREINFGGVSLPAEDSYDMTDAELVKDIVKSLQDR